VAVVATQADAEATVAVAAAADVAMTRSYQSSTSS